MKLMRIVRRLLTGGYMAMMGLIVSLLLMADGLSFLLKRSYLLTYPVMLAIGLIVLLLILFLVWLADRKGESHGLSGPKALAIELGCWGFVFAVQCAFCYFTYFRTGWDADIIVNNAFNLAKYNNPLFLDPTYFSQNPNNVLIVEIYAMIIRVFCLVAGDPGLDRCILILLFAQCALSAGTGLVLRRIVRKLSGSQVFSIAVAVIYVGFVALSPWVLIPYTDSLSLFVPVLCLYLYQRQMESARKAGCWVAIGFVSAIGYLLKPQTVIVTIAIVIWETLCLFSKRRVKEWCMTVGGMLLVLYMGIGPLNGILHERSLIHVDPSKSKGMMNYFMMGMNPETRGTFSGDDMLATLYMPDDERSSIQLQEGIERIREMGPKGFLELMRDKILINYSDGMFAWGFCDTFYAELIKDKDEVISPFLKNVVYNNGKYYPLYATGRQCIWVALLMGCLLMPISCCVLGKPEQQGLLMVMMLSIIGLTLFECIFEALARYLYAYSPVYLVMGMMGLWYALAWIKNKLCSGKTEN